MKHIAILVLFTLLSIGCHHARVKMDSGSNQPKGEVKMLHHKFWVGGFFPRQINVDATKLCPAGVNEIDEYYRWQDAVLTQVTLGIYVPRTLKITCN